MLDHKFLIACGFTQSTIISKFTTVLLTRRSTDRIMQYGIEERFSGLGSA